MFSRTKHGADKIVRQLAAAGIAAAAIHGNKSQPQRERAIAAFKSGQTPVLIATDIAARGIDIPGVSPCRQLRPARRSRAICPPHRPHRARRRRRRRDRLLQPRRAHQSARHRAADPADAATSSRCPKASSPPPRRSRRSSCRPRSAKSVAAMAVAGSAEAAVTAAIAMAVPPLRAPRSSRLAPMAASVAATTSGRPMGSNAATMDRVARRAAPGWPAPSAARRRPSGPSPRGRRRQASVQGRPSRRPRPLPARPGLTRLSM